MDRSQLSLRLVSSLLVHGLVSSVYGTFMVAPVLAGDSQPGVPAQTAAAASTQGRAGMVIYIDPQTGALRRDPAPGTVPLQVTPQLQDALSTSDAGLVPVPSPVPGGGMMVDLQGRFQSPLIATIDANGTMRMQHLHTLPTSGDPHHTDTVHQEGKDK